MGLFLASGQALAVAGPVGALLGYTLMSLLTASVALTTGEMSSFMPVSGGFVRHAAKFVQPALGVATGWNYCKNFPISLCNRKALCPLIQDIGYMMAVTGPAELSAAATLITYWNPNVNAAVWYTIFIVIIVAVSFCGVRVYGEVSDHAHIT